MPKLKKPITGEERIQVRRRILSELNDSKIHLGEAIRQLRLQFTGLSQKRFGKIVGFSATTISAIERDPESATVKTINKILRKFGMHLTMGMIISKNA
ncbi:DNA-binding transcriptional regulator, XRE-family HTH domain [Marinobacter sp. LV10R510-11A]|uniref:helix-turn-helix domain-containing protein n=1 Tax=Marinobacter sp. LV10R510-11A TaxID=1415568 RepID=UPI000BB80007|nr:helix-turn-helix domain-containing protein [Marinobacter sp. LV10R510-11A]SOB76952.1 DNA-binding transcriptional regulator, XRE-family HTH domain [Marinobacter sp. LV10R510-11A]